jgi:hypothetical protein
MLVAASLTLSLLLVLWTLKPLTSTAAAASVAAAAVLAEVAAGVDRGGSGVMTTSFCALLALLPYPGCWQHHMLLSTWL